MSRGLGRLQREILKTLDEAKATEVMYGGGPEGSIPKIVVKWLNEREGLPFPHNVTYQGRITRLPDEAYDLRASAQFLAKRHGRLCDNGLTQPAFQTAFSRAVRGLVAGGHLVAVGLLGFPEGRQVRLVTRPEDKP